MSDLSDYIADNYGECVRDTDCYFANDGCRKIGWLGRACPHWRPVMARDWDELAAAQENFDEGRRRNNGHHLDR